MHPLRLAAVVAAATGLVIALGQLWLRSLDSRVQTFERAARVGSDASVGVAIAGLKQAGRSVRRIEVRAAPHAARPAVSPSTQAVHRPQRRLRVAPTNVLVSSSVPPSVTVRPPVAAPTRAAVKPPTVRPTRTAPKPKPIPKPAPKPVPKPVPKPTPAPAPTPTPAPAPAPAPAPTPAPTPATPTPAAAPAAATPPAPTPQPAVLTPAPTPQPATPPPTTPSEASLSSRPGWGHGDPNHDHNGPPGRGGGQAHP